jgi:outer membrane lipoprotein SlyB
MRLPVHAAAVLVALLGVAGCAPKNPNTNTGHAATELGRSANVGYGTIVAMRPVVALAENTGAGPLGTSTIGGNDVRGNVLGAIGGARVVGAVDSAALPPAGQGPAVEFIVHQDGGEIVSVVQANDLNFVPGERVALAPGARTRLARGAPPAGS